MTAVLVEIVGWAGAAVLLLAYGLLATRRLSDGATYHALNLTGAAGLGLNGAYHGAVPSVALNVVWVGLGLVALRAARRSSQARGTAAEPPAAVGARTP